MPRFIRDKFSKWVLADHKLDLILKEQQKIMAAIDDLKKSVADLNTSFSNELDAISTKLSSGGTSDADVEAVVAQIDALKEKVDAETTALTGVVTPTPAV
jgi:predicted  nucleic acid-binding Zn-ribbon protein